jgi:uncharacterized protein (DUF2141 family)
MTPEFRLDCVYAGASFGNFPDLSGKEISMRVSTKIFGITAAFLALPSFAHDLTLKVENIKSSQGDLLVSVYDKAEHYNANTNWVAVKKVKMEGTTMSLDFAGLPAGSYAIKLFQDENSNGQIDKNSMGIPTEPYGFSNNGGSYGPPSFDEAKVVVDKAIQIEIQLR